MVRVHAREGVAAMPPKQTLTRKNQVKPGYISPFFVTCSPVQVKPSLLSYLPPCVVEMDTLPFAVHNEVCFVKLSFLLNPSKKWLLVSSLSKSLKKLGAQ